MSQITLVHNPNGIHGLAIIKPTLHADARGCFMETYNQNEMRKEGLELNFVQDNQSCSLKGVLRGLHYQKQFPQGKLVRVILGSVYDVAIDLRRDSPTYKKYFGLILDDKNCLQFYIPSGFAHGFLVLSEKAIFAYKVTDYWHHNDEGGLAWDDPEIDIAWPIEELNNTNIILNDKDRNNPTLKDLERAGVHFVM